MSKHIKTPVKVSDNGVPSSPEKKTNTPKNIQSLGIHLLDGGSIDNIIDEYLDLLDTSAAAFDLNGNYLGCRVSSGWCDLLNTTSRDNCETDDEQTAMKSGKWHCHESCWKASKSSIEKGKAVDIGCLGGIRLHAVPIFAKNKVIGSLNFGYSDPPKDLKQLKVISKRYGIDVEKLSKVANEYETRPPFIIDIFKKRLKVAARLTEEIVVRKEAEESLKKSEERYRTLVEASPSGIQEIDTKGKILFGSASYHQMLGYKDGELHGRNIRSLLTRKKKVETMSYIAMLVSEQPENTLYIDQKLKKDGTVIDLEVVSNYKRNEKGKVIGLISVISDITARKRTEQERESLMKDLEAKNEELERFSYTVSHDLKSPILTIRGYLDLLKTDLAFGTPEQVKDDIDFIEKASKTMDQLVQDLLELSRVGAQLSSPEAVSLEALAKEALDNVTGIVSLNNVKVQIDSGLPMVYADSGRIREVLENLINNAAKFMGDQLHPLVKIGFRNDKNETVITVRDNGIGIASRHFKRIFGLFNQLDQEKEGSGAGLSIVKQIIKIHNGRLWVESEGEGHGSTFCFTLPQNPLELENQEVRNE